jgi:hypothetical protein
MAGHGRSKNGVASLADGPAIPLRRAGCLRNREHRDSMLRAGPVMTKENAWVVGWAKSFGSDSTRGHGARTILPTR